MTILILGHKGMLGHMVCKYYRSLDIEVEIIDYRWPSNEFKKAIETSAAEYLINCIAAIAQKGYTEFFDLNTRLPIWIANHFKGRIINPATDGEFSGNLEIGSLYTTHNPRDAYDGYGLSKASASSILSEYSNVKQLRTSINGPELGDGATLFSWFHKAISPVKCITNHYWSGITSLEWAKQSLALIQRWEIAPQITQLSSKCISKMQLLEVLNEVFELNKELIPIEDATTINRCLRSDRQLPELIDQFKELKQFYYGRV